MTIVQPAVGIDPVGEPADVLNVEHLTVEFKTAQGWRPAVRDVSFSIKQNEIFGLVGESGSGKSVTALTVLDLHPARSTRVAPGSSIRLRGTELARRSSRALDRVRGSRIGMIFQEPMSSLNPAYTIGEQIAESYRKHRGASRKQAHARAIEMLDQVGIPSAARNVDQYPHHFSGGMRQRAMIAMALVCDPELLIADEPTTALDVTVQALILDLIVQLQRERDMSVLLITHDLGVIAEVADRVGVLYAGELVETDATRNVYDAPKHPYSSGLLSSILRIDDDAPLRTVPGSVPSIGEDIAGCRFAARCAFAEDRCRTEPVPIEVHDGRLVRCVRADELALEGVAR